MRDPYHQELVAVADGAVAEGAVADGAVAEGANLWQKVSFKVRKEARQSEWLKHTFPYPRPRLLRELRLLLSPKFRTPFSSSSFSWVSPPPLLP